MINKLEKLLFWAGYAAFLWSVLFGLFHVYWAFGGTGFFNGQGMEKGSLLYYINMAAIVLSFLAAILALAFVQSWGAKSTTLDTTNSSMDCMYRLRFKR